MPLPAWTVIYVFLPRPLGPHVWAETVATVATVVVTTGCIAATRGHVTKSRWQFVSFLFFMLFKRSLGNFERVCNTVYY